MQCSHIVNECFVIISALTLKALGRLEQTPLILGY